MSTKYYTKKISEPMKSMNYSMENALYDFYLLVDMYQKTYSFAALTRSFSNITRLVNKNRTLAFSMK